MQQHYGVSWLLFLQCSVTFVTVFTMWCDLCYFHRPYWCDSQQYCPFYTVYIYNCHSLHVKEKSLLYLILTVFTFIHNFCCVFVKYSELPFIMLNLILKCYIVSSYILYLVHSKFLSLTVTVLLSVNGSDSVYSVARGWCTYGLL